MGMLEVVFGKFSRGKTENIDTKERKILLLRCLYYYLLAIHSTCRQWFPNENGSDITTIYEFEFIESVHSSWFCVNPITMSPYRRANTFISKYCII